MFGRGSKEGRRPSAREVAKQKREELQEHGTVEKGRVWELRFVPGISLTEEQREKLTEGHEATLVSYLGRIKDLNVQGIEVVKRSKNKKLVLKVQIQGEEEPREIEVRAGAKAGITWERIDTKGSAEITSVEEKLDGLKNVKDKMGVLDVGDVAKFYVDWEHAVQNTSDLGIRQLLNIDTFKDQRFVPLVAQVTEKSKDGRRIRIRSEKFGAGLEFEISVDELRNKGILSQNQGN